MPFAERHGRFMHRSGILMRSIMPAAADADAWHRVPCHGVTELLRRCCCGCDMQCDVCRQLEWARVQHNLPNQRQLEYPVGGRLSEDSVWGMQGPQRVWAGRRLPVRQWRRRQRPLPVQCSTGA
jgi:hypothetical protein